VTKNHDPRKEQIKEEKITHTWVANSGLNSVTTMEKKLDDPGSNVTGSAGDAHHLASAATHSGLSSFALS